MTAYLPRPISIRCAICDKPVEHVEVFKNPATLDTEFMVRCHGETEKCALSYDQLVHGVRIVDAVAFGTKRIAA